MSESTEAQSLPDAVVTELKTKFCKHCGQKINVDAVVCTKCGLQVEELKGSQSAPTIVVNNTNQNQNVNNAGGFGSVGTPKSKVVAIILCLFGFFFLAGLHRFYEGKIFTGLLYLFTGGLFFVGTVVDLIILLVKPNTYYV